MKYWKMLVEKISQVPGKRNSDEEAGLWFYALLEAKENRELNDLKDWAYIFREGLPAASPEIVEQWLKDKEDYLEIEEKTMEQWIDEKVEEMYG